MPKSKTRKKPSNSRYGLYPQKKQKVKPHPKWFAPLMLGIMAVGVLVIVWNMFHSSGDAYDPKIMWVGMGLIAGGFFGISFWR